ncbi:MAG: hypothetical protein COC01_04710 [Bacteroidetes bacterium]|nr:MAG: hypothetical protein COC01_04710 [Bacteroidota bacterium]
MKNRIIIACILLIAIIGCNTNPKDHSSLIIDKWKGSCSYNQKVVSSSYMFGDSVTITFDSLITLEYTTIEFLADKAKISGINDTIDKTYNYSWYNGFLNFKEFNVDEKAEIIHDSSTYTISVDEIFVGELLMLDNDSLIMKLNTFEYSDKEKDYMFKLRRVKR